MKREDAEVVVGRFIDNVILIGKAKGTLGEIERKAEISTGYLSRLKSKKKRGVSMATAVMLADAAGENLFDLLVKDYKQEFTKMRMETLEKELEQLKSDLAKYEKVSEDVQKNLWPPVRPAGR